MAENTESIANRILASVDVRQEAIERMVREIREESRANNQKVEAAVKEIATSTHAIEKNVAVIEAEKLPVQIDKLGAKFEKLDDRVRKLENWQNWIMGGLAIIYLIVGFLIAAFLKKFI